MTIELYSFAQSGNAYKVANYLNVAGIPWTEHFVDFFNGGARTPEYRSINPMGEVPAMVDGDVTLSQSGAMLEYLIDKHGHFATADADKYEVLRWVLWDNHKFSSFVGPCRFMMNFLPEEKRSADVIGYLSSRVKMSLDILNTHLEGRKWIVGETATSADFSCCSYLFYDEPFGMDRSKYPHIEAWLENIRQMPNWKHPYDLMQGHPL